MCRRVTCRRCQKATYAGCGMHVNEVLAGVPQSQRCACDPEDRPTRSLWSILRRR